MESFLKLFLTWHAFLLLFPCISFFIKVQWVSPIRYRLCHRAYGNKENCPLLASLYNHNFVLLILNKTFLSSGLLWYFSNKFSPNLIRLQSLDGVLEPVVLLPVGYHNHSFKDFLNWGDISKRCCQHNLWLDNINRYKLYRIMDLEIEIKNPP